MADIPASIGTYNYLWRHSLGQPSKHVCVLSEGETEELRSGDPVFCCNHKHVSSEEAFGMTAPIFMQKDGQASEPVAEWVGPRQVRYKLQFTWKTIHKSFLPNRMHLVISTKQLKAGFA